MTRHRRRSLAWAAAALVLAGVALSDRGASSPASPASVEAQVLITARALPAGHRIAAADLAVRRISAAAVDQHRLTDPAAAIGRTTAVSLAAGSPVMDAELAAPDASRNSRDVALRLDDLAGVPAGALPGMRADLYLTEPGRPPHTRLVLSSVEVVAASASGGGAVATLRLPRSLVPVAIASEGAGQLRLVVDVGLGP